MPSLDMYENFLRGRKQSQAVASMSKPLMLSPFVHLEI